MFFKVFPFLAHYVTQIFAFVLDSGMCLSVGLIVQKYVFAHVRGNDCETDLATNVDGFMINVAYISVVVNTKTFTKWL